jgi:RHS repeat-associated protein
MPASPQSTELCRYRYDPLDRRVASTLHQQPDLQHFYCKSRLASEIQGAQHRSIFQHDDQLLAQQSSQKAKVDTTLLATDQQRSVLNTQSATQSQAFAYTPYGERSPKNGLPSLLGFKGERLDALTGNYDLGNGYRRYNTWLKRFDSPDSLSPFGEGGLNAYGFVAGDPVNFSDPTGHVPFRLTVTLISLGVSTASGIAAGFTEGDLRVAMLTLSAVTLFTAGVFGGSAFLDRRNGPRATRYPQAVDPLGMDGFNSPASAIQRGNSQIARSRTDRFHVLVDSFPDRQRSLARDAFALTSLPDDGASLAYIHSTFGIGQPRRIPRVNVSTSPLRSTPEVVSDIRSRP